MADFINVYSQNCRGIKMVDKRRDLFQFIRKKKYNIICLQDVHIESNMESYVKSEWGYNIYLSPYTGNSRGVMILLNNNFECDVGRVLKDPNGNFIIIDISIQGKKVTVANIYSPNDDNPQFYNNLRQKISQLQNENVIICGDWNLTLNQELDTDNYRHVNNPRARDVVLNYLEEDNYIDVWRVMNEDKKTFTWRRLNPERKQARLDFFLITEEIFKYVHDTSIVSGYRTDHSGVILKLKMHENERGKGYWKFNSSLLKDKEYVKLVKDTIKEVVNIHSANEDEQGYNNEQHFININNENIIIIIMSLKIIIIMMKIIIINLIICIIYILG